jgi:hypothetical protein
MSRGFRKGVWAVLFGEALTAAAVIAFSPKAREAARPYLVKGIRGALALGDEFKDMIDEAKLQTRQLIHQIEAEQTADHSVVDRH